jgi:hypothetical protein
VLGLVGILLLGVFFALCHLFDLHVFWLAGRDVLHGRSPYPVISKMTSAPKDYYVYPPIVAVLSVPLAVLPFPVAGALYSAALVAAMFLTLRILGVRDWVCYSACLVWAATLQAIALGTVGPLLALLLAVAWRYRDRRVVCALAVAGAVCLKLFLWPLLVWLVATRRLKTGFLSLALGVAAAVAGWAAIGFAGLTSYPALLNKFSAVTEARAFSIAGLNHSLGLPENVGRGALLLAGAASVTAIVMLARGSEGDRRAFAMAIAAALLLSPVVWLHYFCLLAVPIAIARPRMSMLWLIPVALPLPISDSGSTFVTVWALGVAATVFVIVLRPTVRARRPSVAALPGGAHAVP